MLTRQSAGLRGLTRDLDPDLYREIGLNPSCTMQVSISLYTDLDLDLYTYTYIFCNLICLAVAALERTKGGPLCG